jgi:hypothetical protein
VPLVECELEFRAHDFQSYIIQMRYECKNIFGSFSPLTSQERQWIFYSVLGASNATFAGLVTRQTNEFTGLDLDSVALSRFKIEAPH